MNQTCKTNLTFFMISDTINDPGGLKEGGRGPARRLSLARNLCGGITAPQTGASYYVAGKYARGGQIHAP